jgi:hypothetical protein
VGESPVRSAGPEFDRDELGAEGAGATHSWSPKVCRYRRREVSVAVDAAVPAGTGIRKRRRLGRKMPARAW